MILLQYFLLWLHVCTKYVYTTFAEFLLLHIIFFFNLVTMILIFQWFSSDSFRFVTNVSSFLLQLRLECWMDLRELALLDCFPKPLAYSAYKPNIAQSTFSKIRSEKLIEHFISGKMLNRRVNKLILCMHVTYRWQFVKNVFKQLFRLYFSRCDVRSAVFGHNSPHVCRWLQAIISLFFVTQVHVGWFENFINSCSFPHLCFLLVFKCRTYNNNYLR